jgi:heme A synthase
MRSEATNRWARALEITAITTMGCTFALVVLGSTVRVTNSGMGCPSWPLCYGKIGPIDHYHALLEQSHRYLVALVSLGTVLVAALAWRCRASRPLAFVPSCVAVALVVAQAGLGALTVLTKNAPWTVAVHLVVGLVFLASTMVTAIASTRPFGSSWRLRAIGRWGWFALAATLGALVGGSLVVANAAGGACVGWPLCPAAAPPASAWQLAHRSLVGLAGVGLAWFAWSGRSRYRHRRARFLVMAACGQYVVAAAFGAASALSQAAASWQDVHLAMAALLWALVVATMTLAGIERQDLEPAKGRLGASELRLKTTLPLL